MTELENETTEDLEVEEVETDDEEITYDDYQKKVAGLSKAEKKIVELKKQLKEKSAKEEAKEGYLTKEDLEMEKFIDKNPELAEYKEDLAKHIKNGYSLKQAKLLVESDDKTIEQRKKTNSLNMSGELSSKTTYTRAELASLSQSDYNKVMDGKDKGDIKIKG